jgi:hypothetical protein
MPVRCWLGSTRCSARNAHVVYTGILERAIDELKRFTGYELQAEGAKVPREIGAIVDEFIIYEFLNFGDGKPPTRGFVCTSPSSWGYPAKDRSGRLEQIEPPHLGKLINKITTNSITDRVMAVPDKAAAE